MDNRRKTVRPASGYWPNPFSGDGIAQYPAGNRADAKTHVTKKRVPALDFLTAEFKKYPITRFSLRYSEENYYFLYRSARNYAKLIGQDWEMEPDGYDFSKLYRHFNSILPQWQECEFYMHDNTIYFHVIDNHWDEDLHFIPCCIIDSVEGELKEIYRDFFTLFQYTQGLTVIKDDPVYSIMGGDIERGKADEDVIELYKEYQVGEIGKTLDSINVKPGTTIRELKNRILKFNPRAKEEPGILLLMLEGLELFRNKNKITKYYFFPYENDDYYNAYCPVDYNRILMIGYDMDMISDCIREWVWEEIQENGAEVLSAGDKLITPDTCAAMKPEKFVIDFYNWLKRFENELSYV